MSSSCMQFTKWLCGSRQDYSDKAALCHNHHQHAPHDAAGFWPEFQEPLEDQVIEEARVIVLSKGTGKGGSMFPGTCHHCGQRKCPRRMWRCSRIDPRRDKMDGRGNRVDHRSLANGRWQLVGSGALGWRWTWLSGARAVARFREQRRFDEAPQEPPMFAMSGLEPTQAPAASQGWNLTSSFFIVLCRRSRSLVPKISGGDLPKPREKMGGTTDHRELPIVSRSEEWMDAFVFATPRNAREGGRSASGLPRMPLLVPFALDGTLQLWSSENFGPH